ncbi:hypothetical protein ABZP36_024262 [Zizania latifolia]
MARARWMRRPAAAAALPLLGLCAFVCAVVLVASLAPPGEEMAVMPSLPAAAAAAAASTSLPAVGRRLLLPAARSRRFRPRRWNSAGIDDSKHEVPSGPNPDSNR